MAENPLVVPAGWPDRSVPPPELPANSGRGRMDFFSRALAVVLFVAGARIDCDAEVLSARSAMVVDAGEVSALAPSRLLPVYDSFG